MKKLAALVILAIGLSPVAAQNPRIIFVASGPSGSCASGAPLELVVGSGIVYSCQSGTWGQLLNGGYPSAGIVISTGSAFGTSIVPATGISTWLAIPSSANLSAAMTDETGSGSLVFSVTPTITTPIINGTSSGTGVSQTGGPGTIAQRDGSNNLTANNFLGSGTVVTAAAGTTTLTVGSSRYQFLTGSTTQTFQLPSATTVTVGTSFWFNNNSTGTMTINNGLGSLVASVPPSGMANVVLQVAGSTAGTWDWHYLFPTNATLFANLPSCSTTTASLTFWVTDSSTQTWGAIVTGTGTPATPYTFIGCDGVNWTVIGK